MLSWIYSHVRGWLVSKVLRLLTAIVFAFLAVGVVFGGFWADLMAGVVMLSASVLIILDLQGDLK